MKKRDQSTFEKEVKDNLKFYGMFFPTSEEEVKIFEKLYGSTDIEMPLHLRDSNYLLSTSRNKKLNEEEYLNSPNLSYAARDENSISSELREKMRRNRKDAEKRAKGDNNDGGRK